MEKTAYMTMTFPDADASFITTIGDAMEVIQEQVRNLENGNGCETLLIKPILLSEEEYRDIDNVQQSILNSEEQYIRAFL